MIILVFAAAGKLIFSLFGITLPAFRITGGVLVALVGFQMLQSGEHSSVQHPTDQDKQKSLDAELEVAITPLAMPILAGPGTIATAMNFGSAGTTTEFVVTVGAFFLLCVITFFFFVSGERFVKYIGDVNGGENPRKSGEVFGEVPRSQAHGQTDVDRSDKTAPHPKIR